jgi:hypothetical protein
VLLSSNFHPLKMTISKPKKLTNSSTSAKNPNKKPVASKVGAPAQHNQSTRKGKKAWRKNVDLEDLEEKLEDLREEERVLGYAVSQIFLGITLFILAKVCAS